MDSSRLGLPRRSSNRRNCRVVSGQSRTRAALSSGPCHALPGLASRTPWEDGRSREARIRGSSCTTRDGCCPGRIRLRKSRATKTSRTSRPPADEWSHLSAAAGKPGSGAASREAARSSNERTGRREGGKVLIVRAGGLKSAGGGAPSSRRAAREPPIRLPAFPPSC
jgi:hypothetical protein